MLWASSCIAATRCRRLNLIACAHLIDRSCNSLLELPATDGLSQAAAVAAPLGACPTQSAARSSSMFGKQAHELLLEVANCPADNLPAFNVSGRSQGV